MFTSKILPRVYHYPPPPISLESWGCGALSRQNLEPQGLILKIFRNKELARFFA